MRFAAALRPSVVRLADRQSRTFVPARYTLDSKKQRIRTAASMSKEATASKFGHLPRATTGPIECSLEGTGLLHNSYFNKGSAFPPEERREFKLHGLLPPNVQTLDEQVTRAYQQYSSRPDDLAKNTFMNSMKVQSEVLYYKLIQTHIKEMFSVIYTPTEGDAIQNFSRIFRRPEGCYLNIGDQDQVDEILSRFQGDIDYIVVSDGEEILGIGDQGVGAILISIAKLVLTTLCAGIHPSRQLPVVLDCGTDNEDLLNDELYLGLRQRRVRGKEYDQFVDKFVESARNRFPHAYIHFEDFGLHNAKRLLDKYRPHISCFNDDIQGTGCVTLAAIMAALHVSKVDLKDVRVVVFGSGSAGTGVAAQIADAIATESKKSKEEASKQIWCLDKPGLLLKSHGDKLTQAQVPFARDDSEWPDKEKTDLLSVVKTVKPHVLIGTSTKPGAFTEDVIREMAKHVDRPIVFPLSNPTRLHEAQPKDINDWTEGRALIATGSPFPPVEYNGTKYEVAECNNSTCFPGIGLGVVLSRARLLSDKMLVAAVKALAAQSPALQDPNQPLLPDIVHVREISVHIAKAVIQSAVAEGLAQEKDIPQDEADLEEWIRVQMWEPKYRALVRPRNI
ncbi:NAD-dependent malic enzyme, mitochondrial [Paecilomyces lecythidis]